MYEPRFRDMVQTMDVLTKHTPTDRQPQTSVGYGPKQEFAIRQVREDQRTFAQGRDEGTPSSSTSTPTSAPSIMDWRKMAVQEANSALEPRASSIRLVGAVEEIVAALFGRLFSRKLDHHRPQFAAVFAQSITAVRLA